MRYFLVSLCLGTALLASAGSSYAQQVSNSAQSTVSTISYQGVLAKDGVAVPDGDYTITVTLYRDGLGASNLWSGTYTVHTSNGVFNILLGSGDYPLPASAQLDGPLFLGVKIGEGAELPLTQLSSAISAMNVADGSITAKKMGTDYIGSISINGQRFSTRGGDVNIITGDGMLATVDQATNSIILSATSGSSALKGKGTDPQNVNTSFIVNQYGTSNTQTNATFNIDGSGVIGTTLAVGGASTFNGNVSITGSYNLSLGGNIIPIHPGSQNIGSSSNPFENIYLSNNATIGGNVTIGSYLDVNGNANIYGFEAIYDGANIYDSVNIYGDANISGLASADGFQFFSNSNFSVAYPSGNITTRGTITSSGNITSLDGEVYANSFTTNNANYFNIDETKGSAPTNGEVLTWNSADHAYEATPSSGGGTGATGVKGATGVAGSNGLQGATGLTGATGVSGSNGSQGATGVKGATGISGLNGLQGATGVTGATGLSGSNGSQGATGIKGATGLSGSNGLQGATGVTGATGVPGSNGSQGATGVTGATGVGAISPAYLNAYNANNQTVANNAPVVFGSFPYLVGFTTDSSATFTAVRAGVYDVEYTLTPVTASDWAITVNSVVQQSEAFGCATGTTVIHGNAILTLAVGDHIQLINNNEGFGVGLTPHSTSSAASITAIRIN